MATHNTPNALGHAHARSQQLRGLAVNLTGVYLNLRSVRPAAAPHRTVTRNVIPTYDRITMNMHTSLLRDIYICMHPSNLTVTIHAHSQQPALFCCTWDIQRPALFSHYFRMKRRKKINKHFVHRGTMNQCGSCGSPNAIWCCGEWELRSSKDAFPVLYSSICPN